MAIQTVLREPEFRTEFLYFSREKRPKFRRKRDLYEPLLTAMAQVLPFLIFCYVTRKRRSAKRVRSLCQFWSLFGHCFWCFCYFFVTFLPDSFCGMLIFCYVIRRESGGSMEWLGVWRCIVWESDRSKIRGCDLVKIDPSSELQGFSGSRIDAFCGQGRWKYLPPP